MHFCPDIPPLRAWRAQVRHATQRVALVPTMGALHQGHLALVAQARQLADLVVLSVFVNPLQFGPSEDLARYPRDLERDRRLAEEAGVDLLFAPSVDTMYPPGSEIRVHAGPAATRWEGAVRPGHFDGVLTVVTKLFHLVEPEVAVFGQKDIQQATLVRRLVRDLDLPVAIAVCPTVREGDGLALSSRNAYLSPSERQDGLGLIRALRAAARRWSEGEHGPDRLAAVISGTLKGFPGLRPDYIAIVDPERLEPVTEVKAGTIIALAGRVGSTRLIDNHILGTELP
jgi:pantoate--beta-alanine ligase